MAGLAATPATSTRPPVSRAGRPRARCPRTRVCTIAVSKVIHLRLHGSPWSAFHGGHRPGRCRQPGEPGFPPACASAAVTGCNWGCSTPSPPPAGAQPGVTGRFIRTGPGRGHAHPPVRAQSSFGCGFRCRSTGSSCRSGRERPGSGESRRKPVTKHGRGTHAAWARAKRTAPQATGMACGAAPGRYSSSTTSRRKTGAC